MFVQLTDIRGSLPIGMPLHPGTNDSGQSLRLEPLLPTSVLSAFGLSPQVIAHGPFADPKRPSNLAVVLAFVGQNSNRHDFLLTEAYRHPRPPSYRKNRT